MQSQRKEVADLSFPFSFQAAFDNAEARRWPVPLKESGSPETLQASVVPSGGARKREL
jgi:hypothetical protein